MRLSIKGTTSDSVKGTVRAYHKGSMGVATRGTLMVTLKDTVRVKEGTFGVARYYRGYPIYPKLSTCSFL